MKEQNIRKFFQKFKCCKMNGTKGIIKELLENLSRDYANSKFIPILEADVTGYLYYLWVSKIGDASRVHLDTRICGLENSKFDFVVGDVNLQAERPCIKPELVIEIKSFPTGFTNQQHRVHYFHVIENDIPKLGKLNKPLGDRYILLFDEDNYLKGFDRKSGTSRIERISMTRKTIDSQIKVIWINKEEKMLKWKIL
jgi:hypothetical protein